MPNKWTDETKAVVRRVTIGVVTVIATSAVIYLLGFEKSKKGAGHIELKKNTIKVWREFVKIENALQPRHDTIFARVNRGAISINENRRLDSIISYRFIKDVQDLSETPDIDPDMVLLLKNRMQFKEDEWQRAAEYTDQFMAIRDSIITVEYKNYLIQELNNQFNFRRDNAVERLGRSMEDLLIFMTKKYKYPFELKDINWNEGYLRLKALRDTDTRRKDNNPPF